MHSRARSRSILVIAVLLLGACATSVAPPSDGTGPSGGNDAGNDGNPYGAGDADSDAGGPMTDASAGQDTGAADTGRAPDSSASDTGSVPPAGVCAKTSAQQVAFAAAVFGGTATDCSASPAACATGECCYQTSTLSLCVPE